ncbi:LysM-like peptidoglycan-binding domain-containing protein [Citrobacter sp. JGM124]|uniref:OapA family protein n=1 Tax=Citrobacter sp. JGM124 TaxID=2799789 RepID=UPI001BAA1F02|nr:LysM-like peptidoglycan-binding domain-containing protein [Citrobacter sp. JGM124]MBS0849167.1 hypothetical protein [Citrobacter sp. JGM124]
MGFAVKPWLTKIWHAPEQFRILDPLPPAHRRGIIACALLIVVCFLWPAKSPQRLQPQVISLDSQAAQPLQANLVVPSYNASENERNSSPAAEASSTSRSETPVQDNDTSLPLRTYQIAPGQTMAQLFRDNNLPPTDVYAMAQVEGNDKPLSNLQAGQTVHIRENKEGMVTDLTIENEKDNKQVHFIRQQDGSFILSR